MKRTSRPGLFTEMNPAAVIAAARGDLSNALIASTPGGIERQEVDGQRAMIESTVLPKRIYGATREQLTALGFKFGSDVDELFVSCELPSGWKKQATEHSMHSEILDDQGRERAHIFYKAAFYDRNADMTMTPRYGVRCSYEDDRTLAKINVVDFGASFTPAVIKSYAAPADPKDWKALSALEEEARQWLTKEYPERSNPLAYW